MGFARIAIPRRQWKPLCQLFGELYRKAGIKGASSHSGRRGFITKLAHSGISSKVIMELAGHKDLQIRDPTTRTFPIQYP